MPIGIMIHYGIQPKRVLSVNLPDCFEWNIFDCPLYEGLLEEKYKAMKAAREREDEYLSHLDDEHAHDVCNRVAFPQVHCSINDHAANWACFSFNKKASENSPEQ